MKTCYCNPDTLFTKDGELSQLAFVREAVTTAGSVIAVLHNDQISLWAEKRELPLLRSQNGISQIYDNIFMACAGLPVDARVIVDRVRQHLQSHKLNKDESLTVEGITRYEIDLGGDYWEFKARAIGRFSNNLNRMLDENYFAYSQKYSNVVKFSNGIKK